MCSIGLRSGKQAGRKSNRASAALMAFRMAGALWLPGVVKGEQDQKTVRGAFSRRTRPSLRWVATRTCPIQGQKAAPLIGPPIPQGAVIASWRKAAINVMPRHFARTNGAHAAIQCPKGALPIRRLPRIPAAPQRGHVGFRRSPSGLNQWRLQRLTLVNEDKALQVNPARMGFPPQALAGDIRPVLLTGERRFS